MDKEETAPLQECPERTGRPRGSNPFQVRQIYVPVTQRTECLASNQMVGGSNPSGHAMQKEREMISKLILWIVKASNIVYKNQKDTKLFVFTKEQEKDMKQKLKQNKHKI